MSLFQGVFASYLYKIFYVYVCVFVPYRNRDPWTEGAGVEFTKLFMVWHLLYHKIFERNFVSYV